ncbi:MAG: hypothetical protein U0U67_12390 [Chitinophagales bacterium]
MNKADFELKSLIYIVGITYFFNLVFSIAGYICREDPHAQILFFQIGNAFAISASVIAGRYIGARGEHVAASSFVLMGITHGISLAALTKGAINMEREMTMAIPMIPALIFIFWCSLFPIWLRIAGLIPIGMFTCNYVCTHGGHDGFEWALPVGYGSLQLIELFWSYYMWKDWKAQHATTT